MTDSSQPPTPGPSRWRRARPSEIGDAAPSTTPDGAPSSDAPSSDAVSGDALSGDALPADAPPVDRTAAEPTRPDAPPRVTPRSSSAETGDRIGDELPLFESSDELPLFVSPDADSDVGSRASVSSDPRTPAGAAPELPVAQPLDHGAEEHRQFGGPPTGAQTPVVPMRGESASRAETGPRAGAPPPPPPVAAAAREVSSTGLSPRVAAILCYAAGWASGLVLLAIERQSRFVRFHAYQAVVGFGGLTLIAVTCWVLTILMAFLSPAAFRVMAVVTQVAWIALVVTWLFVVVEVSQGKRRKLPLVGKRAERAAAALPDS